MPLWIMYALLSAVFAALVAVFGKIGLKNIDSTLATTVRSVIMAIFLVLVSVSLKKTSLLHTIEGKALLFIVLSGMAGAMSWLFYFYADIPGLIEGASEGRGLGIQFLRHIERTRILVHLVSMESGDADQMLGNYLSLREELEKYSPELAEKREILVFTKADLVDEVVLKKLQSVFKKRKLSPIVISSGTRFNIEKLEDELIS